MSSVSILKSNNRLFNRKSVSIFLTCLFIFGSFLGIFVFENDALNVSATTHYVGGSGSGNYTTIQAAIDNASSGDTVYVFAGLYNENLIVNKTLNLFGQNMNTTILNGTSNYSNKSTQSRYPYHNWNGTVIYVNASNVVISGFTIKNGGSNEGAAGIGLDSVEDCQIINNNISSNANTGIYISQSLNITIKNNLISSNKWHGVYLYLTRNSSISNNLFLRNNIGMYASKHNSIEYNELYGPSKLEDLDAIRLYYDSDYTKISNNYITNWTGNGIYIHYSSDNNISDNIIHKNCNESWRQYNEQCAIALMASSENLIARNSITDNNGCGIGAYYSSKNLIIYNKVSGNPTGIWASSNHVWNIIYLNEFIKNDNNTDDISSYNLWNSSLPLAYLYKGVNYTSYLGNYWDDYPGKDTDGNGIGEDPYNISKSPTNKDYFPLMDSFENYTLIPSITKMKLVEDCSKTANKTVSLRIQTGILEANITGTLNGAVRIHELEIVLINSSFFAGFGFFRAVYRAVIEHKVYEGHWQGMLFNKSGERKFYMKGTVFGGLRGLTDGYLTETTNGSGVYDIYNSTWTLKNLGNDLVFVQLYVNGTLDYKSSKNETTQIYVLQGSFSGNATGYYNKSISVVLTHIRITNKTSKYYGHGFSMITYTCAWGSGSGWTYDKLVSPNITKLTGWFTQPLWSLAFGRLDETGSKRTLCFTLERIDVGLPPRAIVIIYVWGPWRASPGQTIHYFIEYRNIGLKSALNTEIIMELPNNTTYKSNTGGGVYYSTNQEVVWRFNISAKSKGKLSAKVQVNWGLSWGTKLYCNASIHDFVQNITLASNSFKTLITPAKDPNMKHGPEGNVTQGQKLTYKIEFENEGSGIAYGVYFTDELSVFLDDSTLEIGAVYSTSDDSKIAPAGSYSPLTRTITWLVGEVGPGAGGYASISIKVRSDVPAGTEILNYGTVFFPSVPEITRTNGIVSIVKDNIRPIAKVDAKTVAKTLQNIIFNGSSSIDQDGMITNYTWNFGDGTKGYGIVESHYYLDDGDYPVTLTVSDDYGMPGTHKIYIQVLNREPVAQLEVDSKSVKTKEVIFNATYSSDIDGLVTEYNFDFGDGKNSGWVNTPIASHIYRDPSKMYTVKLNVRDDDGAISKNSADLEIAINYKPIARLSVNLKEAYTYSDVIVSGELSSDSDGQISEYNFDFGDGQTSDWITTPTTTHQYTDGTQKYAITLKVKDDNGALSEEISMTEILIRNRKPVPELKVDDLDIYVLSEVVFDASGSSDMDGDKLEYYFDFGDDSNSGWVTEPLIKHTYIKGPQDFSVELKVRDSDSEIETTKLAIRVKNRLPLADAGSDQTVDLNQEVNFDGSASNDPEGNVLTYHWDFGDGTTTNWIDTAKTSHIYTKSGEYTVTLSVSDGILTAEDSCTISVLDVKPKKDSDGDGVSDDTDAFPDDAAASVDSDGDNYPDHWNIDKTKDDSTTGLELDEYPNDPNRHDEERSAGSATENIYLMVIIIISIIVIIILTSIIRKNRNKRTPKPFNSSELIREARDEVITGSEGALDIDTELWNKLEQKYKDGQISEDTYNSLKSEKFQNE